MFFDSYKQYLPVNVRMEQIQVLFRPTGGTVTASPRAFIIGNNDTFLSRKIVGMRFLHPTVYPVLANQHNNVPTTVFQRCFFSLAYQQNYLIREVSVLSYSRITTDDHDTVLWLQEPQNITTNDSVISFRPEGGFSVPSAPANTVGESFGIEIYYIC
jgi:hypothetical protein